MPKSKIKGEATSLQTWGEIIERQGREQEAARNRRLVQMKKLLPTQKKALHAMADEQLVEYLIECRRSDSDPRALLLYQEILDYAKQEVLDRLRRR